MGVDVRILATLLLIYAETVLAQERCGFMVAIPRPPRPDLPELDFEGQTWSQRPLIPAADREDVCMDGYHAMTPTYGTQIIYMEEEIEGEVPIAKLNYRGPNVPYIEPAFLSGSFNLLVPVIRRIPDSNGEWHLIITQRQDYETPGMQQYVFNIRIDGETLVAGVSLLIVNIDDNAPIIQALEPCQVDELGEARLTECVYVVTDADGRISTQFMQFRIDSDRGDDKIFYIQGANIPGEWIRMTMTVGINEPLNFETNPLHIFSVTALDSLPNTHTVTLMVQVENVEHRPPRWVEIFAVQQFDEKTAQSFPVRAIDGDTGINKPIHYRLETAEEDTFFHIRTIEGGRSGAILYVDPIDRDTLQREVFQLSIIAYKYDNESSATAANVVIIVNDINDQRPEPLFKEYRLNIMEETALTLNFDQEFGFHDRDLGQNAQYTVRLESDYPADAAKAFYIAPEVGYQRQTFIMGTANHKMLDYEVPEFQRIRLRVIATDMDNEEHVGVAYVYINLINWNDEEPIFEHSVQNVSFKETEGKGFFVANVRAHDRDIDDRVEHTLMGNANNYLSIDKDTGDIHVTQDDFFDYHRQSELFVQVRADDTLGEPFHTATSQLLIHLEDINNTPPTLRLPRGSPNVEENVPEGYIITSEIRATDPDTTAELRFEIDWTTSYATKQGREANPIEFHNCVEIETIYPAINNRGSAIGRLVVKKIRENVTIDYEEFEMLYLTVRVRDLNTVIGDDYDESTFTITIIDMNDNPPIWVPGTLEQSLRVREMSDAGVVIGTLTATDIDGPLYNQVRYTMKANEGTPENLLMIDFYTGQITVKTSGAIDADVPRRYNLYYTVVATDRCYAEDPDDCPDDPTYWETPGQVVIQIIDTNNKIPQPETDQFKAVVYIYEDAVSGDEVVKVIGSDLDRDDIYHTIRYQINYAVNPRLRDFFAVDPDTGRVYVYYTTDEVLDRDGDEPQHRIFFNLIDNFFQQGDGNRNQNDAEVLVVLLDVNDNAPELPEPDELSWSVSESLTKGTRLQPHIYAPDRDEPDTDNSRVGYAIISLTIANREIEVPELFTMIQIQNVTGELETAMDLRGYWGTYAIHIKAYDHGIPQQMSNETYELVIRPYNFHAPVFVFPKHGATLRLARERAVVNGLLATVDGEFLNRIVATDEDGLHAGQVAFEVVGDTEAVDYFHIVNDGENSGTLMLKQLFPEDIREFEVTIRATDGGTEPRPLSTDCTFSVVFVPIQGEPIFPTSTHTVAFIEKEAGLLERHELPRAEDRKNHLCSDDCHNIYYRIIDGNNDGHFGLDETTNVLFLVKELDRSVSETYTLTIAASNSPTGGIALTSTITITVNVREADPQPYFVRDLYTAGISTSDSINRELLILQATHSENAPIIYTIDWSTMVTDPTLASVRETAFILNPHTGVLTLNIQPTASMHGMFEFQVVATDPAGYSDRANVKIYLISTRNRVFFLFVNTLEQVEQNTDFIAQTFSAGFEMTCNIDQVVPATDASGVIMNGITEVRGHFIRDNVPVPADEIETLRGDMVLLTAIQSTLATRLLVLRDLFTDTSPAPDAGSAAVLYALAVLSALLAALCLLLLVIFIIRTKKLNRRLEALTVKKYGSVDSGLNRVGIAAPGTNKHAVEGSNPIWNETIKAPDFDSMSDASNDSDLIGIEDLPHFGENNYFPRDVDEFKTDKPEDIVATHNNNFGFKSTPFSPEFANQFQK
ncbi:cadherin-like membrane protein precursor [Bombyx mori]|uniref:BtR175 n=1 Tax=Bombyx mori TaxID=7091 RepID=Q9XY09_BOMMO|nr:cadherin-like membrane protein precursor [Bombyx mori]pir/JE0128/ Bombyx mori receptor precursor - Bacillus thuringiensis [Bacillus thuringiensis]BAA77212.1 BtR175 [Bombyx mori]